MSSESSNPLPTPDEFITLPEGSQDALTERLRTRLNFCEEEPRASEKNLKKIWKVSAALPVPTSPDFLKIFHFFKRFIDEANPGLMVQLQGSLDTPPSYSDLWRFSKHMCTHCGGCKTYQLGDKYVAFTCERGLIDSKCDYHRIVRYDEND